MQAIRWTTLAGSTSRRISITASRKLHASASSRGINKGTTPPKSNAAPHSFKQGDYLKQSRPGFDQAPEESNVTVAESAPRATNKVVADLPDPSSDPDSYEEADRSQAATSWKPSSTHTSPAHHDLTQQMKRNEQTEQLKESVEGLDRSLPPDFNESRMHDKPKWTKKEMKKRTP